MNLASAGSPRQPLSKNRGRLAVTLEMIQFPHTVFALPFALTGTVLASGGWPSFLPAEF